MFGEKVPGEVDRDDDDDEPEDEEMTEPGIFIFIIENGSLNLCEHS